MRKWRGRSTTYQPQTTTHNGHATSEAGKLDGERMNETGGSDQRRPNRSLPPTAATQPLSLPSCMGREWTKLPGAIND